MSLDNERLARIEEGVQYLIKTSDRDRDDTQKSLGKLEKRLDALEPQVLNNSWAAKIGRGVLWFFSLIGVNYIIQYFK